MVEDSPCSKMGTADRPVDLAVVPGGLTVWDHLLLGSSDNVGINGAAARGYLRECFNAGLIDRATLAEDD
jgi:hypothetical protein